MYSLYLILKQYKIIVKMSPRCNLSDKTVVPILIIIIRLGYLEWPSRRDHHLITSSDQLANCDGHLIIPTEDFFPTGIQHQVRSPVSEIMKLVH